jgi:hypothetical protein
MVGAQVSLAAAAPPAGAKGVCQAHEEGYPALMASLHADLWPLRTPNIQLPVVTKRSTAPASRSLPGDSPLSPRISLPSSASSPPFRDSCDVCHASLRRPSPMRIVTGPHFCPRIGPTFMLAIGTLRHCLEAEKQPSHCHLRVCFHTAEPQLPAHHFQAHPQFRLRAVQFLFLNGLVS